MPYLPKPPSLLSMKPHQNIIAEKSIKCDACSLKQICLPNGLSTEELEELEISIDKTIKIIKKDTVFKANDKIDGIYAVKSGAIKTSIANEQGQEQVLEFHLPGDVLGFDAFNTGTHLCDATALDDTLLCKIPMEVFDDLCVRLPGIRQEMIHQVGKEITHNQNMLFSLGQQHADERVALFLIKLAAHYQSRGYSPREFTLPMPRQDLSNYLGMAVETLSRIISRITESGIITIDHRRVNIHDPVKLEQLAHNSCHT